MKSLKTIQTISKVCKIISKIGFVLSIVVASLCIIAIPSTLFTKDISIDGITIKSIIETNSSANVNTIICFAVCYALIFICQAVLSGFAVKYFNYELKEGTPFTKEGAKKIRNLGILTIAMPVGASVIATITYTIMSALMTDVGNLNLDNEASIVLGIVYIVLSFIFNYGAELREKAERTEQTAATVEDKVDETVE